MQGTPIIGARILPALALLIAAYALLGKTAAYVNVGPLYVAEIVLALGSLGYLLSRHKALIFRTWVGWALLAFLLIQASRTLPSLGAYGLDALRDAALWYYALFLPIAFTLLQHDGALNRAVGWLDRGAPWACWLIPVIWITSGNLLPIAPLKGGDTLVFVGLAYSWLVFVRGRGSGLLALWMLVTLVTVGIVNRGGMLAFLVISAPLLSVLWRRWSAWSVAPLALIVVLYAASTDVAIPLSEKKEISVQQITESVISVFASSGDGRLDSTREWRLGWWRDIIADTGPRGENAWTGHGYGVNLADHYQRQVNADGSLRSPHNAWLTYLARAGVPGLLAYVAVILAWLTYMVRAIRRATPLRPVLLWCVFGVAGALLNSSVDVYLEGPIGGVLLWSLMGFGLAVARDQTLLASR